MKNELILIGLACCFVGISVPAVLTIVHGVATATPLLIYTIPIFILGLILVVKGAKMQPRHQAEPS